MKSFKKAIIFGVGFAIGTNAVVILVQVLLQLANLAAN